MCTANTRNQIDEVVFLIHMCFDYLHVLSWVALSLSSLSHCRKWDIRRHKPWLCREGWLFKAFLMTEPVLGFNRQFCWSALHTLHSSLFLCFIFLASIIVENDICCVGLNMLPMSAFALSPARIILLGTLMLQRLCCYKPWCSLCNIIAYVL